MAMKVRIIQPLSLSLNIYKFSQQQNLTVIAEAPSDFVGPGRAWGWQRSIAPERWRGHAALEHTIPSNWSEFEEFYRTAESLFELVCMWVSCMTTTSWNRNTHRLRQTWCWIRFYRTAETLDHSRGLLFERIRKRWLFHLQLNLFLQFDFLPDNSGL